MTRPQGNDLEEICKRIGQETGDMMHHLLKATVEDLMGAEADRRCGVASGLRSPDRTNSRNGYRERRWDTRLGSMGLNIPKLRQGSYFPSWLLEPRRRAEQALTQVIAEAYLLGVSTRRVDELVRALGIDGIDKSQVSVMSKTLDERVQEFRQRPLTAEAYPYIWVDALYIKVRGGGRLPALRSQWHPGSTRRAGEKFSGSTRSPRRTKHRGRSFCAPWFVEASRAPAWSSLMPT